MSRTQNLARLQPVLIALVLTVGQGCGIDARSDRGDHTVFRTLRTDLAGKDRSARGPELEEWNWPAGDHTRARIEIRGLGAIDIELLPELAPETVQNFERLAGSGFYDGTTFHRVIPGFMIQGGDPLTRNANPLDDGSGGPGYTIRDEFTRAPHLRGTVSMANRSSANSGGSQFFIVHANSQHLDRNYSLFGRVVAGMDVVDRIAETERDTASRWGPRDRPIEPVVIERLHLVPAQPQAHSAAARTDSLTALRAR